MSGRKESNQTNKIRDDGYSFFLFEVGLGLGDIGKNNNNTHEIYQKSSNMYITNKYITGNQKNLIALEGLFKLAVGGHFPVSHTKQGWISPQSERSLSGNQSMLLLIFKISQLSLLLKHP